jgi:hypothetical protein
VREKCDLWAPAPAAHLVVVNPASGARG